MDKAAIKSFAIQARQKMMDNVEYRASLIGITKDEIKDPISKLREWKLLILVQVVIQFMILTL